MADGGSFRAAVTRLAHHGFLWHRPPSFARALIYAVTVLVVIAVLMPRAFRVDGSQMDESHTAISVEMAMARAYCGQPSARSTAFRLPPAMVADHDLRHQSLRDEVVARAGSIEAYCQSIDWPYVHAEYSLMLTETALLRLAPGLSLSELGQAMHGLRIALLFVFVLMLLDLGASLALAAATLLCGLMLLQSMTDRVYAHYPFLFVLVLATTALHVFALKYRWTARWPGLLCYGLFAGIVSAFVANMRTSYTVVAAALFVGVLVAEFRSSAGAPAWRPKLARSAALAICFVAGYMGFQAGLVMRHLPAEGQYEASHSAAHPLVLALGVPENPLSQRLGITWDDAVGPKLAATVDPRPVYLNAEYNAAMRQYYFGLWQRYPREMAGVYYLKFSVAGADMVRVLRDSPGPAGLAVRVLLTPLAWLPNGLWLLALYGLVLAGTIIVYARHASPAALALGLLTLAACLLQVESGVIFPLFVKQYHNYAAFFAMFLSLLGAQAVANGAASAVAKRSLVNNGAMR